MEFVFAVLFFQLKPCAGLKAIPFALQVRY